MAWIKDVVNDLIKKYGTNDPFELAECQNINVCYWDLHDEINGFYKYSRRNKFIFINKNLVEKDKIFVCAHELGHAQLHPKVNTPFLRKNTLFSIDKIELEANAFAVELLLPDDEWQAVVKEHCTIPNISYITGIPEELLYLKQKNLL